MASPIVTPPIRKIVRLAYRSDTRPPEVVFRDGLYRRPEAFDEDAHQMYQRFALHPELREERFRYALVEPEYRNQAYVQHKNLTDAPSFDINPRSAVCLTFIPALACIFPLTEDRVDREVTWVYAALLDEHYATYELQRIDNSELYRAQEVAVRSVPNFDIIGAVQCVRYGGPYPKKIKYIMRPRIRWNPLTSHFSRKPIVEQKLRPHFHRMTVIEVVDSIITWKILNKDTDDMEVLYDGPDKPEYLLSKAPMKTFLEAYNAGFRSYTTDDIPRDAYKGERSRAFRTPGQKSREI